jgi:hypothetical protein
MFRFLLIIWGALALARRLIVAHLAVVNDGSPSADEALPIDDVMLAQAFYGSLPAGGEDYYRFVLNAENTLRLSMLVPVRYYQQGFQPTIVLYGPGLPEEGLVLPPRDEGMRDGTTLYQRTQRTEPTLAAGSYLVQVRSEQAGVYCFCVGTREPDTYADAETRARVQALLSS